MAEVGRTGSEITLWEASTGSRRVVRSVVAPIAVSGVCTTVAILTHVDLWAMLPAYVLLLVVGPLTSWRDRLRLTADGVEVRGWRTRLYRYADLESVEVSPDWESGSTIWLRTRDQWPQSAPDVLVPPGGWLKRHPGGLQDAVAAIRSRVEAASTDGVSPAVH